MFKDHHHIAIAEEDILILVSILALDRLSFYPRLFIK